MKSLHEFSEIFLCRSIVDGRKAINGLSMIVQDGMKRSAFAGGLFVFTSRRKNVVRILYWDKSGYALWTKRLETEKFRWPSKMEGDVIELSSTQLSWLLEGFDITRMKPHQTLSYTAVS